MTQIGAREIRTFLIPAALLFLALAVYAFVGFHARPMADDYCSAASTAERGVVGSTVYWYETWSGRYSASFFDALVGAGGSGAVVSQTLIIVVLWTFAFAAFLRISLRKIADIGWFGSSILAATIVVATLQLAPDVPQSLYWGQGMRSVLPPLVAFAFLLCVVAQSRPAPSHNRWACVSAALIAFVAGGFAETWCVLQLVILSMLIAVAVLYGWSRGVTLVLLAALVGGMLSLVAIALAPGTDARMVAVGAAPPEITETLTRARWAMQTFAQEMFSRGLMPVAVCAVVLTWVIGSFSNANAAKSSSIPHPVLPIVACGLLVYIAFLPAAYGLRSAPPDRNLIIPVAVIATSLALAAFLAALRYKAVPQFVRSPRVRVLLMSFAAATLLAMTATELGRVSAMTDYRAAWDQLDEQAREARSHGITAISASLPPNPAKLGDIGHDPHGWVTKCAEQYFGVKLNQPDFVGMESPSQ